MSLDWDVESHIGLVTNVHTETTRKWLWKEWSFWKPERMHLWKSA